ncbi:hypothetical protein I6B53_10925 [Schaalia sp. 19OD2882]|uniref:hypothetical protein n=1 Tax=Schaalia sp. 19OD2882 TaxID=2794089 RepID=UPI001C1EFA6C|nr:hypothetical protein [Schaalia sp. 19OD2882]QWW19565.1 hypothetical protein I6B53_10925 [Schaalia sp. 19OD2882]
MVKRYARIAFDAALVAVVVIVAAYLLVPIIIAALGGEGGSSAVLGDLDRVMSSSVGTPLEHWTPSTALA